MLKIDDLKVRYGGIEAVKGISFEVPEGAIVTLIGANGAGKSTTLRTIAGLVQPAGGRIHFQAEDITALSPDRIVSKGITLVPEGRRVFPDLTVLENLRVGAYLRKDREQIEHDLNWVYELFPRLKERSWQAAGTLSGGEQQMLAVGRALMSRPKLIMMDEPSLGLAPLIVKGIFDIIKEINRMGVTVLLIEQNANMALKIADIGYVLETGKITLTGPGSELLANEAVKGISFEVPDGKIVTLIGANGAGKSTTLRTISGLVKAQSGSIQWNGEELLGKPIDRIISAGIAMSPEGRRVFADMTVLENLKIGAYLRRDRAEIQRDLEWVYDLSPRLKERSWQLAGTLSGGEQQMLAVGRALMSRPRLMMLDEPSLGLAPLVVQDIFSIIREINRQGVTVLLIEQNANMALKTADLAYVLETGSITLSGTGAELLANEKVKEAYLGKHS